MQGSDWLRGLLPYLEVRDLIDHLDSTPNIGTVGTVAAEATGVAPGESD